MESTRRKTQVLSLGLITQKQIWEGLNFCTKGARAISLLSVIELRVKDQPIAWDVPNPIVYELTDLDQPSTFQVRSNKNKCIFRDVNFVKFFVNNFFAICMGVEGGGGTGEASPAVEKSAGDVAPRKYV